MHTKEMLAAQATRNTRVGRSSTCLTLVSLNTVHMAKLHTNQHAHITHINHTLRAYFLHTVKHLNHHEHTLLGFLNVNMRYTAELPPYAVHLANKAPPPT